MDDRAVDEVAAAPSVESYGQPASATVETVTNGPVPDTAANRERYGEPMSNGGRRTSPAGNWSGPAVRPGSRRTAE